MSDTPKPRKREAQKHQYPKRLPTYGSAEDLEMLQKVAAHLGSSMAGTVRQLIRQEAYRLGIVTREQKQRINELATQEQEQERRQQQVTFMRTKMDATDDPAERITMGKTITEEEVSIEQLAEAREPTRP